MSLVRHEPATSPSIPDAHEYAHLERMANSFAASMMCPPAFKNKPAELLVVALSLREMDVPFTLNTLNQTYVIDGKMELMAQLKAGVAARHGWEVWFNKTGPDGTPTGEVDDTHAIVHYQGPGKPERTMEYTIVEARDNHLLDEWVETEVASGGTWPDGNPKKRKVKVTVAVDGVPVPDTEIPEWARKARHNAPTKRKDPWFNSRESMLMARAVTKALRYAAPHLTLGIGEAEIPLVSDRETAEFPITAESHDTPVADPETGEIMVDARAAKEQLIDAYIGTGLARPQAESCAAVLWGSYQIPKGQAVTRSQLDRILAVATLRPAPAEPSIGIVAPETTGDPPLDVVTPEIVHQVPNQPDEPYAASRADAAADDAHLFDGSEPF